MPRSLPLYVQVESLLRQRIRAGFYPLQAPMPTEERLQHEFRVSRATIRLALDTLHRDGLIRRQAGRGTFVNEAVEQPRSLWIKGSIEEVITLADGAPADFIVTDHRMTEATGPEAAELKIPEGGRVLRITGLRKRGQERVAHVVACVPEMLGALLTLHVGEVCPPIIALLKDRLGKTVRHARQVIGVGMADPIVAEALAVPVGAPLLTARRTYFAADGTALEFAISSYPGDGYQFETIIYGGA